MGTEATVTQAFWSRVDKKGPDDCWLWLGGYSSRAKYGRFWDGKRNRPAHQVAWEIANERPFPQGMMGCHSCDNPPCVNPNHIWPGTAADNSRDCLAKGRHSSKPRSHCQRGHPLTGNNRKPTTGGYRCATCARVATRERVRRYRERQRSIANGK